MNSGEILRERYQIEHVLGHGSMGTTYKALDVKTQHPVAVKQLHFSRMGEWKSLEMFEREARILQQLRHPRIPAYIEYFSEETASDVHFFLVQEYIEGSTLEQFIEEGWKGTETEVLDLFLQLVEILTYLHHLRPPVIHRDINPKNIILSPSAHIFLVDFGAVQEVIRTTFLGGSTIVGTFGYIPFEQFSGQTVPASDYYALGATLLYMLTHRHPGDFPTDDLKLNFHTSFQASPQTIRLLDGLLEPSVETRIASPEYVKAILEGKPVTHTVKSAESFKPARTRIKKIVKEDGLIYFSIPKRLVGMGIPRLLVGLYLSVNIFGFLFAGMGMISIMGLLLGLIGVFFLGKGMFCLLGRTVVELTPTWVNLRKKILGVQISRTQRIPTRSLRESDINRYFQKGGVRWLRKRRSVVGINFAGKTLELGRRLTEGEAEWLIQELHAFLASTAKSKIKK